MIESTVSLRPCREKLCGRMRTILVQLLPGVLHLRHESERSCAAMPSSRRSSSPEAAALRAAVVSSRKQLLDQARRQARLIRSGAVSELTEADVKRMAQDIIADARARLDAAAPPSQSTSADPELQAERRGADEIMTATARQADAVLLKAWQARHGAGAGRRWRR
jgi:hypothetical protein